MRSSRVLALAATALALVATGCSSSTNASSPPGVDAGSDTKADSTTDTTTSPTDTGASETDAQESGPLPACDSHTGDECNMVANTCTGNQTCVYDDTVKHNRCTMLPLGPNADGDPCSDTNGCVPGLICQPTSASGTNGICSHPCCSGDDSVCKSAATGAPGRCALNIVDSTPAQNTLYHLCTYNEQVCQPFAYDCGATEYCNFTKDPDVFTCSTPAPGKTIDLAPGDTCAALNDCGESQGCFGLTLGDGGSTGSKCWLFCWLTQPTGFTVGANAGGRFPANGTCTVNGKSYGKCTSVGFPDNGTTGGHLGVCVP